MTDLRCSVTNCLHNEEHLCCKREIKVNGEDADKKEETCCGSFCDCGCNAKNKTGETPTVETEISCNACSCQYNENEKCHARSIEVCGVGASHREGTLCETYKAK